MDSFPAKNMQAAYHSEDFSEDEQRLLRPYFTNLDGPVFALKNLPEVVKGALFARYSRSPHSLRRLFLNEFVTQPELGIQSIASSSNVGSGDAANATVQAERLYRRIFSDYGDDSVAQLGGVHLACEQSSNLLTKVLEWGRLAAYLEQSTRYIRYVLQLGSGWRYFVPGEIERSSVNDLFRRSADGLFEAYSTIASRLTEHFEKVYPISNEAPGVWRATLRAKACDIARGLLPLATKSNVGIYANGQAYEAMILRMRAHPLEEARSYADLILKELSSSIPAFMARVDVPEKGGAMTAYLAATREATERRVEAMQLPAVGINADYSVKLIDWDADAEQRVLCDILFSMSEVSLIEARNIVRQMPEAERQSLLMSYVGQRGNRRHKPGRAFEASNYQFEITCDYANFRDLQRHRMLTIEWQRATPIHGFTLPPLLEELDLASIWKEAVERSASAHKVIAKELGLDVAQYVLPFCSRIRFQIRMNAREAMHFIELRTAKGGHSQYRQVCHLMLQEIRERAGHKLLANSISYADLTHDYEFSRVDSERRAAKKRLDAGIENN